MQITLFRIELRLNKNHTLQARIKNYQIKTKDHYCDES